MERTGLSALGAAVAGVLGIVVQAQAAPVPNGPVVSLQFSGWGGADIANSSTTAGVVSAGYWNYQTDGNQDQQGSFTSVATSNGGVANAGNVLLDSTGSSSGITYSYAYTRVSSSNGSYYGFATGSGDYKLATEAAGVQSNGPATLTISGLNANTTYDIIAYVNPMYFASNHSPEAVSLGATTYYLTSNTALTGWVQAVATSSAAEVDANYVEFDGLTGSSSQTLTVLDTSSYYGLGGVQIIPVSAPEPASMGTLGLGLVTLLAGRRRRA